VSPHRIGLLTPFQELPGEVQDVTAGALEPAVAWQVLTQATDDHAVEALLAVAADEALLAAVARMRRWSPDVVVWACASGSFVVGRAGALAQIEALEDAAEVPATSTSLAFVEALAALALDTVSLVAPYPAQTSAAFADFLGEWGVTVRDTVPLGCAGPSVSQRLGAADVEQAIAAIDPGVPVLLPDTAVWGIDIRRELAPRLDVPLLVANQVTLWHAFDLVGMSTDLPVFGDLRGLRAPEVTRAAVARRGA
jgi:maleate cis-trans isomerase